MFQEIEMPDGTILEFPMDMSDADIAAALQGYSGGQASAPDMPPGMAEAIANVAKPPRAGELPSLDMLGASPLDMDQYRRDVTGDVSGGETASLAGLNGLTFGLGDEAIGAANAVKSVFTGGGFGDMADAYKTGRDNARTAMEVGGEQNPGIALGTEIAGAVASPLGLLSIPKLAAAGAKAGTAGRIGAGAVGGGAGAGLYGFNDSEGGPSGRAEGAVSALPFGLAGGAVLPALAAGWRAGPGKWAAQRKSDKAFAAASPDIPGLKSTVDGLYDAVRGSGAYAPAPDVGLLRADILTKLRKGGVVNKKGKALPSYTDAKTVLTLLKDYADGGMTAEDMLTFRSVVSDMANGKTSPDKVKTVMRNILSDVDTFLEGYAPVAKDARAANTRLAKLRDVTKVDALAENQGAVNYTKAGYETAIRHKVNGILKKVIDGAEKRFTAAEIAQMEKLARGGSTEKFLRWVSRSAPNSLGSIIFQGGGPAVIGSALGFPGLGIGLGAGAVGTGAIAKRMANKGQSANVDLLKALVSTGKTPPQVPALGADAPVGLLERLIGLGAIAEER